MIPRFCRPAAAAPGADTAQVRLACPQTPIETPVGLQRASLATDRSVGHLCTYLTTLDLWPFVRATAHQQR